MSARLTPVALMMKADRACASARALLELGDADGACNRAYYAMYDAARAALLASGAPVRPDIGKTHSGPKPSLPQCAMRPARHPAAG